MEFYLGINESEWLGFVGLPMFVSHRLLANRRDLPQAVGPWALDSGGFTEVTMYGEWRTSEAEYIDAVRRYRSEIGELEWCATQDWTVAPPALKESGLDVAAHQHYTVQNYVSLREKAPDLPWVATLQGLTRDDFLRCVEAYEQAGVKLDRHNRVGVGTIAARESGGEVESIILELRKLGLRLHGFGVKQRGLKRYGYLLDSADSVAWWRTALWDGGLSDCFHRDGNRGATQRTGVYTPPGQRGRNDCTHCLRYALRWRRRILDAIEGPQQLHLVEDESVLNGSKPEVRGIRELGDGKNRTSNGDGEIEINEGQERLNL